MTQNRIRPPLKRWLIPLWNSGHRIGGIVADYLNSAARGRFAFCAVCGRYRLMVYRRRIIPPRLVERWGISAKLARAFARKESCFCTHCGASLRARRLATALLSLYPVGAPPAPARSLSEWIGATESRALRVAGINRIDGLRNQLLRLPQFSDSDYYPGATPGSIVDGVRSEDLMGLTYPDSSFDVVLTSETLEHIPDLQLALDEIYRVLVPGGRHLFTIPQLPHVPTTFARSVVLHDGTIEDRAPRICHPGGDVGYPVFTEFGADLKQVIERAGFEFEVLFGPNRDDDVAQVYVARKPAAR